MKLLICLIDLSKKIDPTHLNPDVLIGKYIPNLIAKPFDISREYSQIIYDQTSSPRLDKVLRKWDEDKWGSAAKRQQLAYIILVELLAYQFASPVRWIQTQDLLFTQFNFERLIELGPSPTLTGMATHTLKAKYEMQDDCASLTREILCHAKHSKEIYYLFEDDASAASEPEVEAPAAASAPVASTPAPVAVAAPVAASGPAASIEDVPIKSSDILIAIVSQKLKKPVSEISMSKSIKDLVGGKRPFRTRFWAIYNRSSLLLLRKERNCLLKNSDLRWVVATVEPWASTPPVLFRV